VAKLTEAQRRVLENIAAGRDPYFGFKNGREARGGITGPVATLDQKGLLEYGSSVHDLTLTHPGRQALTGNGRG